MVLIAEFYCIILGPGIVYLKLFLLRASNYEFAQFMLDDCGANNSSEWLLNINYLHNAVGGSRIPLNMGPLPIQELWIKLLGAFLLWYQYLILLPNCLKSIWKYSLIFYISSSGVYIYVVFVSTLDSFYMYSLGSIWDYVIAIHLYSLISFFSYLIFLCRSFIDIQNVLLHIWNHCILWTLKNLSRLPVWDFVEHSHKHSFPVTWLLTLIDGE